MTWLKCSDDYANGCITLNDAEYRTLHEALLWVMSREAGPRFPKRDVRRFAETYDPETAVKGLVNKGHMADHGDEYEVLFHIEHQPEPEVIVKRKANDATRQRKKRRKAAGLDPDTGLDPQMSRRDDTRDMHRDHPRDPGRGGSGRENALRREPQDDDETLMEGVG